MLQDVLDERLANIINYKIEFSELNEIRIRAGKPIVVYVKGQPYYISDKGLCCNLSNAIYGSFEMIQDIVYKSSDYSIYSVNEQLKRGFLILDGGIRIGLCGDVVEENNKIITTNNWTSLNIRIPHQIKNVSLNVFNELIGENGIKNTLIISPPGAGKTTFIRDFVFQMSENNYCSNVCVVDERGEISGGEKSAIKLGNFCDVIKFCSKSVGFEQCIRVMNPNLIVTDEIGGTDDVKALKDAMNSGVKVLA
ncbi:MAG: hypothetical protein IJA69_05405, partial [Clostridia bacterium]|nr:hypothetical protein [Clostridia bacterium]